MNFEEMNNEEGKEKKDVLMMVMKLDDGERR